jgi:hypothetical protein
MNTRTHIKTGISDLEWFRLSADEAKSDPVGFWEIVKVGRQGFGLCGYELEMFVTDFILEMLKSGAQCVVGDKGARFGWIPISPCPENSHTFAESLIADWRASKTDPDIDGVWFAFPSAFS